MKLRKQNRNSKKRRQVNAIRRTRTLVFEQLEDRLVMSGLFTALSTKVQDSFNAFKSTIQDLFSAEAADALSSTWSDAYDDAVAAGPMPNQITGPGATLFDAHRDYVASWQASESTLSAQVLPTATEIAVKNLGDFTQGSFNNAISSPTVWFSSGMAGLCWGVDFAAAAGTLTPWCASLTVQAARTFATEFAVDFFLGDEGAVGRIIDNTDLSASTKSRAHKTLDLVQTGIDIYELRKDLLDISHLSDAADILEPLYNNANATSSFIDWVQGLHDNMEDLFRSNDPASARITEAVMLGEGIRFQARRIGEQVLNVSSQRSLTSSEQDALRTIFIDPAFSTDFLEFTTQQAQQLLQAVGPLNDFVRVQNGQVIVLGTDGADTIDVFSSVDVTGDLEITVNTASTVVVPRSAAPNGVAVYSRGGDDHVSIRSDIASVISGGAGNDTLIGG